MKVSYEDLRNYGACSKGIDWFAQTYGMDRPIEVSALKDRLVVDGYIKWAEWLCSKVDARELSLVCHGDYECWTEDVWRFRIVYGHRYVYSAHTVYEQRTDRYVY